MRWAEAGQCRGRRSACNRPVTPDIRACKRMHLGCSRMHCRPTPSSRRADPTTLCSAMARGAATSRQSRVLSTTSHGARGGSSLSRQPSCLLPPPAAPARLGRTLHAPGCAAHSRGAPQPPRPQWAARGAPCLQHVPTSRILHPSTLSLHPRLFDPLKSVLFPLLIASVIYRIRQCGDGACGCVESRRRRRGASSWLSVVGAV